MDVFDDQATVKDALGHLFQQYGIPSDAYTASHFTIPVGRIEFRFPNIPARVKVAQFHDLHHILTGYPTTWLGEAEIGAWELATGCRGYFIAWFLNGGAAFVGLFLNPKAVIRAFRRGWKTPTNLYHDFVYTDLLDLTLGELRKKTGIY